MTFTWPEFCGNLFPCASHPSDGLQFTIEVTGVPEGQTAIYPESIYTDAPPGGAEEAAAATANLTATSAAWSTTRSGTSAAAR